MDAKSLKKTLAERLQRAKTRKCGRTRRFKQSPLGKRCQGLLGSNLTSTKFDHIQLSFKDTQDSPRVTKIPTKKVRLPIMAPTSAYISNLNIKLSRVGIDAQAIRPRRRGWRKSGNPGDYLPVTTAHTPSMVTHPKYTQTYLGSFFLDAMPCHAMYLQTI